MRNRYMEEEGTMPLLRADSTKINSYSLYFKGLVNEKTMGLLAGFGVAICDQEGNLLFQMKGPIHGSNITVLEAELKALKRGLTEAVRLGITDHISIYCDQSQIYGLVMGISVPEKDKIVLLNDDVQCIRQKLTSSNPVLVTEKQTKFAYTLAMEAIASEISIHMPPLKKSCRICFNDDLEAEQMFYVAGCGHQFCVECVKRDVEVRLLERRLTKCPHYGCESKLTLRSCATLLTPKLREIWLRKIEENSIPVWDRVYCPNPRCSALASKTELLSASSADKEETGVRSCCFKCDEPFCINCKVPWHSNLLCKDYKRLQPNPTENDGKLKALAIRKKWRQCGMCKHMVDNRDGCIHVTCRCGYSFCHECGDEWKQEGCPHRKRLDAEDADSRQRLDALNRDCLICILILCFVTLLAFVCDYYTKAPKVKPF